MLFSTSRATPSYSMLAQQLCLPISISEVLESTKEQSVGYPLVLMLCMVCDEEVFTFTEQPQFTVSTITTILCMLTVQKNYIV